MYVLVNLVHVIADLCLLKAINKQEISTHWVNLTKCCGEKFDLETRQCLVSIKFSIPFHGTGKKVSGWATFIPHSPNYLIHQLSLQNRRLPMDGNPPKRLFKPSSSDRDTKDWYSNIEKRYTVNDIVKHGRWLVNCSNKSERFTQLS